jgi:AcrR family transcriptional regulator
MTRPTRRRRAPAEARNELLDAAATLIAERGPDGVGLRLVAEAVGVRHGLVTHYFGTYGQLVREVLSRENQRLRDRVRDQIRADAGRPTSAGMVRVLFETLADERYVRLFAWAELHAEYPAMPGTGLRELADTMETGIRAALAGRPVPSRARIEAVLLIGLSAAYGYAIGGRSWLAGLGHDPAHPAHDAAFQAQVAQVLSTYMAEESGLTSPDREEPNRT